jgi:anti-sigma regulatory factor (Ser/Thr protein kinase)
MRIGAQPELMSLICPETLKYKHFFTLTEYKDCRTALIHVLTNLVKHGGRRGALSLRFQVINDKRVIGFILLGCGEGFVDIGDNAKRIGHVPIHEVVKEGRSFELPRGAGCVLTQTVELTDHISITTTDTIGGESHTYYWEKGFSLEQPLESDPVENGTKITFCQGNAPF